MERMEVVKTDAKRMVMGGLFPLFLVGCNLANKPGTSPIVSDRGVEYLDFTPGEIPQWKKVGELNLPTEGSTPEKKPLSE